MFQVRVKADFAAAHFLQDYHGKCENLHGHNYKVYAHIQGFSLDEGGMLLDFGELKKALRKVCEQLDHTNLNDITFFAQNPSAERIALYIYDGIIKQIPELKKTNDTKKTYLWAVDVFETDNNRARYIAD
ncbi:6-carboxytetrahydropterin synthase QueD [Treponema sp.]|uniref:6-carboxytetrahydropterin synthase QueD n=1 Tax=Treponema sp. TaxID=166 RepID=UPI00388DDC06